jgi:small subunit ribosomal protein S16
MLKVKLSQVGKKNKRSYRIVIAEARSKRDGKVVEKIGYYNPKDKNSKIQIKQDRLNYWVKNGAQITEAVRKLI